MPTIKPLEVISIKVEEEDSSLSGNSRLLAPRDNATLNEGDQILLKAFISEGDRDALEDIYFLVKKSGQLAEEIASVSASNNTGSSTYSVIWDSPPAGTYELYLKIVLEDGKLRFSKKVPVVVR